MRSELIHRLVVISQQIALLQAEFDTLKDVARRDRPKDDPRVTVYDVPEVYVSGYTRPAYTAVKVRRK